MLRASASEDPIVATADALIIDCCIPPPFRDATCASKLLERRTERGMPGKNFGCSACGEVVDRFRLFFPLQVSSPLLHFFMSDNWVNITCEAVYFGTIMNVLIIEARNPSIVNVKALSLSGLPPLLSCVRVPCAVVERSGLPSKAHTAPDGHVRDRACDSL